MEELRRNKRLVSAHDKLVANQATRIGEINAAIVSCDDDRIRTLAKIEAFGESRLFNPGAISRNLRDLSAKRVQLQKDLAAAELEQARLEIVIERLREQQVELQQFADDEQMAESIEEWTNLDVAQAAGTRR